MIVHFCKFNIDTGECVGSGACQSGMEDFQTSEGERLYVTESQIHWSRAYIKDGRVFDSGDPPSEFHKLNYAAGAYYLDSQSAEEAARAKRNSILARSDWVDTYSAQTRIGVANMALWIEYRQKLRDISSQPEFPFNVDWPAEP